MQKTKKPNILIIVCDQLAQRAVGAYGSAEGWTPNIDSIAARGVVFSNAYTPFPLCIPARASFWTGRYPHETGVVSNTYDQEVPAAMPALGTVLADAGYECVHYGKRHDCGALKGFRIGELGASPVEATPPWTAYYDSQEDRFTVDQVVEFLGADHSNPFCVVADLNNPHDICLWIGDHAGVHADEPLAGRLPDLPGNFEITDRENLPAAIRENVQFNTRIGETEGWTPDNFRHYLAAYGYYTRLADADVGRILATLHGRHDAEDTLIFLLADHGEGMASHKMVTKGGHFYEEAVRVPFIAGGWGIAAPGRVIEGPPTSLIDLVPTVCDMLGVAAPDGLPGLSLAPALRNEALAPDREYVVSRWADEGKGATAVRMLRTGRHKYIYYADERVELLYDLDHDPGEMRNLAVLPEYGDILVRHRALLKQYCRDTHDTFPAI